MVGMFEGKDFRVQGLAREINLHFREVRPAKARVVGPITDQWKSGMRSLHTDLMFSSGFQPKT